MLKIDVFARQLPAQLLIETQAVPNQIHLLQNILFRS